MNMAAHGLFKRSARPFPALKSPKPPQCWLPEDSAGRVNSKTRSWTWSRSKRLPCSSVAMAPYD